jgi:hypothetical protein
MIEREYGERERESTEREREREREYGERERKRESEGGGGVNNVYLVYKCCFCGAVKSLEQRNVNGKWKKLDPLVVCRSCRRAAGTAAKAAK